MTQSPESGGCGLGCSSLSRRSVPTFIPCSEPPEPPWDHLPTQAPFTFLFVLLISSTWFCQGLRPGPRMTKHPWLPPSCATPPCRPCPRRSSHHGPCSSRFPASWCLLLPGLPTDTPASPAPPVFMVYFLPPTCAGSPPGRGAGLVSPPPLIGGLPSPGAGLWGGPPAPLSVLPAQSCRVSFPCSWDLGPWEVCLVPPGVLCFAPLGSIRPPCCNPPLV